MAQFASDDEVFEAIGGMFAEALEDAEIGPGLAESGVVLHLAMTDPRTDIVVDMPGKAVHHGVPEGLAPTMTLKTKADVAHEYWLGEVNVGVAVARGRIRVRGPVPTLVQLAGLAKPLFPRYRARMGLD